ncbi:MAG: PHP-associated domain-containing protein [Methanomicrobiaceae archaeon]|nr:PHP-associated domain-containing protein [Methanomicrobiaceae archaeon]
MRAIVRSWERQGVLPLVCDHDTTRGAEEVFRLIRAQDPDIPSLIAEEITTGDGEIIGVFLTEPIAPNLSAEETLDRIRDQGAISMIPHPFCTFRKSVIDGTVLRRIVSRVDIIEGYNARVLRPHENNLACDFAVKHGKPVSVGSDAHTATELGQNYLTLTPFEDAKGLVASLADATYHHRRAHPIVYSFTRMVMAAKAQRIRT